MKSIVAAVLLTAFHLQRIFQLEIYRICIRIVHSIVALWTLQRSFVNRAAGEQPTDRQTTIDDDSVVNLMIEATDRVYFNIFLSLEDLRISIVNIDKI